MAALTLFYVVLSAVMWRVFKNKKMTFWKKCLIGVVYGCAAILSTHFGVQYSQMVLNVRDIAPLSAGLFFDPVSGMVAGLIGGIERFIAGTFWNVGSYTSIACSVSTVLAGFLAAFLNKFVFRGRLPNAISAMFAGAVMEVFHMYAVFITHQDDMSMATYVVKNCSIPMIAFTGIGLALSVIVFLIMDEKKLRIPKVLPKNERPLLRIFTAGLLLVTSIILLINFLFAFSLQTKSAEQDARDILSKVSSSIRMSYTQVLKMQEKIFKLAEESAESYATVIANQIMEDGGLSSVDQEFTDSMVSVFDLSAVDVVDAEGNVISSSGNSQGFLDTFQSVLDDECWSSTVQLPYDKTAAAVECDGGLVQVTLSTKRFASALNFDGVSRVLSLFQVGNEGSFDIIDSSGKVTGGGHDGAVMSDEDMKLLIESPAKQVFEGEFFGIPSLCWKEELGGDEVILTQLSDSEVYSARDAQAYQTALADILVFGAIYAAVYMLVQYIVVRNLKKVNKALGKITAGDLDVVVDVRKSAEFDMLSNDINKTVTTLKGYISAAEKRMAQDMEMAKEIQESTLPKNFSFPHHEFELYASMNPARLVGGDFYDFFFVSRYKLAMVIADVSGKGFPAALFMMRGKTQIQNLAKAGLSPAEIMFQANNSLCEGNDAEMFITAWIGILDLRNGMMSCANAGHEYPVLMRAGKDYELFKDKHGMVLGGLENVKFKEYELQLFVGDRLFVYTDGIPEAINEEMDQFGTERLVKTLNTLKEKTEQETLTSVLDEIYRFAGKAEQFDDITMLGFNYQGSCEGREK